MPLSCIKCIKLKASYVNQFTIKYSARIGAIMYFYTDIYSHSLCMYLVYNNQILCSVMEFVVLSFAFVTNYEYFVDVYDNPCKPCHLEYY